MEDPTSDTTHDLLLALAGRVDDDLLRWARELVALGEDARAVEMLTASLVAARAVLPPQVRSALVAAARTARTDLGPAAALPPPQPETGTEHRFAAPRHDDPVAGAVREFPARPLTGCSVLLARRLTPAGAAPGPLPHPVVVVRVHDYTRRADVLAYQLGAALERAGAPASVEVLPADGPAPAYHAAALQAAVELRSEVTDDRLWRPAPQAQPQPAPPVERHAFAPPADRPPRRFAPEPHPLAPEPPASSARYRRETVRAEEPEPRDDDATPTDNSATATARLQATGEREPEEAPAAPFGSENGHLLDDEHDEHDDDNADDLDADHDDHADEDEDGEGDEDDLPGGYERSSRYADEDDDEADRHDGDDGDDDPAARTEEEAFPEPPSPHPLAAPRPLPVRDESRSTPPPPPTPLPPRGSRPRPTVTPISRAASNPIPLVRRSGSDQAPQPVGDPRPPLRPVDNAHDDAIEPPADERPELPQEPPPPRRDTPAFESLSDPLNGPLNRPLLAPLLDPTRPEDDLFAVPEKRPEPAARPTDDEWSQEWLSGAWAMAPSALEEPAATRAEPEPAPEPDPEPEPEPLDDAEPGRPAPRPVPRAAARHRFLDDPPPNGSSSDDDRSEDPGDEEPDRDGQDREDLGLRPESIARLSDADRQLLARLQAELLEGRRQRIARRITNGAPTNGSRRGSPPDYDD